jgi:hypothetical protein
MPRPAFDAARESANGGPTPQQPPIMNAKPSNSPPAIFFTSPVTLDFVTRGRGEWCDPSQRRLHIDVTGPQPEILFHFIEIHTVGSKVLIN